MSCDARRWPNGGLVDELRRRSPECSTHADIILTAHEIESNLLVGISRAMTDFHYCTYLSDLAVDIAYQRHGHRPGIDSTNA